MGEPRAILVQIVFGWPAILLSLGLAMIGLLKKWKWMLVASGVVSIPFAWYLTGYPAVRSAAILLPLFQFVSAWAVHVKKLTVAWLSFLPLVTIVGWSVFLVLTQ